MATLDLRAPSITIKFDKGKTLSPIFYYLSPTNAIINISTYSARMQVKVNYNDATPLFSLGTTSPLAGMTIVTGTATLDDGTLVSGAYGIQFTLTATQTATLTTDLSLLFDIELIDPSAHVLPFIKGILIPSAEVTT